MKKLLFIISLLGLLLIGCAQDEQSESFRGTVIDVQDTYNLIVEPDEDESIRASGNEVAITAPEDQQFEMGDEVVVTHEGSVMESHPLQIELISIERIEE